MLQVSSKLCNNYVVNNGVVKLKKKITFMHKKIISKNNFIWKKNYFVMFSVSKLPFLHAIQGINALLNLMRESLTTSLTLTKF